MINLDPAEASQVNWEIWCGHYPCLFKVLIVALIIAVPLGMQYVLSWQKGAVSGDCMWPVLP